MINRHWLTKFCCWTFAIFLLLGIVFYAVSFQQLKYKVNMIDTVRPADHMGELIANDIVEQPFFLKEDKLNAVSLYFQTFSRVNTGSLTISISDGTQILYENTVEVSELSDNAYYTVTPELSNVAKKILTLRIRSNDGMPGNAVTIAWGHSVSTGLGEIKVDDFQPARKNNAPVTGSLCMKMTTVQTLWFGQHYWNIFISAAVLLLVYLLYLLRCNQCGKSSLGLHFLSAMTKYRFLLHQLVDRDFKTKYKRSALGVFWSFLNPLLTMLVQYIVFSTLFKSDVPNYPVYLLSGIVCFNYFNESVSQCMCAITGNANLITKVYVPKYIYPLSKAFSCSVNLLFSLIPLLLVVLITGLKIYSSFLLLPFVLLCLFLFCLGMGMLLATSMVFFRDTQFLWGVISMLWMYATPIFYPENIISARFMTLYKMNPLYHIIRFFRTILIDGVSPEPKAYLLCFIACLIPLGLGLLIFKKKQDQFILYV